MLLPGPGTPFWHAVTRFGESGFLLPSALLLAGWLVLQVRPAQRALAWLLPIGVAVALTTASKIAFMGWGLGIPALDFTGLSGHSMFAAAVYPVLAHAIARPWPRAARWAAVAGGYLLAFLVALSRVRIDVHSSSECVLGYLVGAVASACALAWLRSLAPQRLPATGALVLVAWGVFAIGLRDQPVLPSHDIVTRIALQLSGRDQPYTRDDLHRGAPRL